MRKQVGTITKDVITLLNLDAIEGTPVYISDSNIEHMKASHPDDYMRYGCDIENILFNPDYVGRNKNDDSIEFVKEYVENGEYVKVAVRVSLKNMYYARTLYVLNNSRVKNFIKKGTLKRLTNNH